MTPSRMNGAASSKMLTISKGSGFQKGGQNLLGDPQSVSALAHDERLGLEGAAGGIQQSALAFGERVVAGMKAEIGAVEGLAAHRPVQSRRVKEHGTPHQRLRRGEDVRRWRHKEIVGLLIHRESHGHTLFLQNLLFEKGQRIEQRLLGRTLVVAESVGNVLGLEQLFRRFSQCVEDRPGPARDHRVVDTKGAVLGAAAAGRALVEITRPLVDFLIGELFAAEETVERRGLRLVKRTQPAGTPGGIAPLVRARAVHMARVLAVSAVGANLQIDPKGSRPVA